MSFMLHIYYESSFKEVDLSCFKKEIITIGNKESDDIIVDFFKLEGNTIKIRRTGERINVLFNALDYFICNGSKVSGKEIEDGDVCVFKFDNIEMAISFVDKNRLYSNVKKYKLDRAEYIVGKDGENAIVYGSKEVSRRHCRIYFNGNKFYVEDLKSTNGTYLNGRFVRNHELNDEDVINVCGFTIIYEKENLIVCGNAETLVNKLKLAGHKSNSAVIFQRSPRLKPGIADGKIEVPGAPMEEGKIAISWLSIILPPVAMGGITAVMYSKMGGNNTYMYMSLAMTGVSVIGSAGNYISQILRQKKNKKQRKEDYIKVLDKIEEKLKNSREDQKKSSIEINPEVEECLRRVKELDRRLWERSPMHEDFLNVRVGIGKVPMKLKIAKRENDINIEKNELDKRRTELIKEYEYIKDCPICLPLLKFGNCGMIGFRDRVLDAAKAMMLQLATGHSYDEVKLVVLYSEREKRNWQWAKWLPHVWDNGKNIRFMADNKEDAHELLNNLYDLIKARELQSKEEENKTMSLPYFVFFITDKKMVENEAIMKYLGHNNQKLGISTVYLFDELENLPKDCKAIIKYEDESKLILSEDKVHEYNFNSDFADYKASEQFARDMSPIKLKLLTSDNNLPKSISLLEMYKVKTIEELNIVDRWNRSKCYKTLRVPLGIRSNGEDLTLDLDEKGEGPHGLVAGTTGSGKSEILQSLIISLAINFHPHDVAFVLIDYKGGGMANEFKDLPHLVGTITNLDGNQTKRALVSIKSELKRRQKIFGDNAVNNIKDYQKLYKKNSGQGMIPLPHLIMIADEFAELKAEQPDFMKELVSTARVGRSLGVHLILATQKPAGVVDDQIWSNSRFKLCLKVQDKSDSNEVIKKPDAAYIKEPGRAYLQVGNDELFELFQSAWSGAKYNPEKQQESIQYKSVMRLNLDGSREAIIKEPKKENASEGESELRVLNKYIKSLCIENGIKPLDGPWKPPLPTNIGLNDILTKFNFNGSTWDKTEEGIATMVGIKDDPEHQAQGPMKIDFEKNGNLLVYSAPGFGKTTFLQTLITSLAATYSPLDVNIYILDFGAKVLGVFSRLPHVGGTVFLDENEKLEKFMKFIVKEIDSRKKLFSDNGVSNISTYKEVTGENIPSCVIFIDNYAALNEVYPELEDYMILISREGSNLGIYVVATSTNTSAIKYKVSTNFKMTVAFHLLDKSEYSAMVGRTNGLEPGAFNGRGLINTNPPLEFQAALPFKAEDEANKIKLLRSFIDNISENWHGHKAKPIPVMPESVELSDLLTNDEVKEHISQNMYSIPIGLYEENVEPVYFDINELPNMLVAGDVKMGKSALLKAMLATISIFFDTDRLKLHLIDSNSMGLISLKELPHVKGYAAESEEIEEEFIKIEKEINAIDEEIKEYRYSGIMDEQEILKKNPINIIVIDDINEFIQKTSVKVKDILERIVRKERLTGYHVFAAGLTNEISSNYDPLMKAIKDIQTGVVLGSISEQQIFNVRIAYGQKAKKLLPGDGYFIVKGDYQKVKTAFMDDITLKAFCNQIKVKLNSSK